MEQQSAASSTGKDINREDPSPHRRLTCEERMEALLQKSDTVRDSRWFILTKFTETDLKLFRAVRFDAGIVTGTSIVLDHFIQMRCGDLYRHLGPRDLNPEHFSMLMEFIYTKDIASFDGGLEDWEGLRKLAILFWVKGMAEFCDKKIAEWNKDEAYFIPEFDSAQSHNLDDYVVVQGNELSSRTYERRRSPGTSKDSTIREKIVDELGQALQSGEGMVELKRQVLDKVVNSLKQEILEQHKGELMRQVMDKLSQDVANELVLRFKDDVMADVVKKMKNRNF